MMMMIIIIMLIIILIIKIKMLIMIMIIRIGPQGIYFRIFFDIRVFVEFCLCFIYLHSYRSINNICCDVIIMSIIMILL